jgi:hypothetical protein
VDAIRVNLLEIDVSCLDLCPLGLACGLTCQRLPIVEIAFAGVLFCFALFQQGKLKDSAGCIREDFQRLQDMPGEALGYGFLWRIMLAIGPGASANGILPISASLYPLARSSSRSLVVSMLGIDVITFAPLQTTPVARPVLA